MQSLGISLMWERFFNWQSDMDWTWGPFVSLRPPQNQPIRPWVWGRLFLIFTLLGLLLISFLASIVFLLPRFAASQHRLLSPTITDTLSTFQAIGNDAGTRDLLFGLVFALPPLFFAFCLPYHWAWNRRARRVQKAVGIAVQEVAGVWPPAIGTHPATSCDPPETGG